MQNLELAKIFFELADLMEFRGEDFKPQAFRKVARLLSGLSEDIADIAAQGRLRDLPGVGEASAHRIEEYLVTGRVEKLDRLRKEAPGRIEELFAVPGLGPKRAKALYDKLKIQSLDDLEAAATAGKIRSLGGFGERSEQEILKGIDMARKGGKRMLLGDALPIARFVAAGLRSLPGVQEVQIAGSVRRWQETIGDIDIVVAAAHAGPIMESFVSMPGIGRVLAKGETKSSVVLATGQQVDVRVVDPASFGAAMQYFTGDKDHNIALRSLAIKKGLKLNEYGLFKGGKNLATSESSIYERLGLSFIPPELREGAGEMDAARAGKLPDLIGFDAVRGDLQMHTLNSDGKLSALEMARLCKARGYEYLAITDHSQSTTIANGMKPARLKGYLQELKEAQKRAGIRIIRSCEIDIKEDGSLDYPDKILKGFELVCVSIHSHFKMEREEMTSRLCEALSHPLVDVWCHPTGRKINQREGVQFDFEKVIKTAVANDVKLEIDAYPDRLDLRDADIRRAKALGAKFTISTDAHKALDLGNMELGIAQARRGWLEAKDVINTYPLKDLPKFFKNLK